MDPKARLKLNYNEELYGNISSEFGMAAVKRTPEEQVIVDKLVAAKLPPLLYGSDIAFWLGVSKGMFDLVLSEAFAHYKEIEIAKSTTSKGAKRILHLPVPVLHQWQMQIKSHILDMTQPSDAAHAYRRGRSAKTGAMAHEMQPYLWVVDLKDFFTSIKLDQVVSVFERIGYPTNAASALARLTCLYYVGLPQGTCTSPAISNLVMQDLDDKLLKLASKNKVTYTRYADDFAFSRNRPFSKSFLETAKKLIVDSGFRINNKKTRLLGPRCSRKVSNLVINYKTGISREHRRNLRALFHRVSLEPKKYKSEQARLHGLANWVSAFHPAEGAKYLKLANSLK